MTLNRLLITSVVVENRPVRDIAAQYGVSQVLALGTPRPLQGGGRGRLRAPLPSSQGGPADHTHRATPTTAYTTRPKATASTGDRDDDTHDRIRHDRVDKSGKVTLRYQGQLYSIGIGRTHARTRVIILVQDLQIRIVDTTTGVLLRELTLDPTTRYQPIR